MPDNNEAKAEELWRSSQEKHLQEVNPSASLNWDDNCKTPGWYLTFEDLYDGTSEVYVGKGGADTGIRLYKILEKWRNERGLNDGAKSTNKARGKSRRSMFF